MNASEAASPPHEIRTRLEATDEIDLGDRPACVKWKQLPAEKSQAKGITIGACKQAIGGTGKDDSVVVIGDPQNLNARADLAKSLAAVGFSNIEPLTCAALYKAAKEFERKAGFARLEAAGRRTSVQRNKPRGRREMARSAAAGGLRRCERISFRVLL